MTTKRIDCNRCEHTRECPIPRHVRKDGVDTCDLYEERNEQSQEMKKHTHTMDRGTYELNVVFEAAEFSDIKEAIAHAEACALEAIHLDGKYFVVDPLEADRLDEAGATFAFVYDLDGKIVTIPVN